MSTICFNLLIYWCILPAPTTRNTKGISVMTHAMHIPVKVYINIDFVVTVLDSNPVTFVCLLLFLTFKIIYDRSFIEDSRNIFFALHCQTFTEIRVMCRRSNSFDNISLQNLGELVFRTCVQNLYRILKINKNAVKLVLFQCKKRINSELKSRI